MCSLRITERKRCMSNPNPLHAPSARPPHWFCWLGALALVCYGLFLAQNFAAVAGGSDSSGYLNSARLFAAGKLRTELRVPPEFRAAGQIDLTHFIPLGFWPYQKTGLINPTYPTGLPLHLALAGKLLGWSIAPIAIGLFAALGSLALLYASARELGIHARFAAAGTFALAVCPLFIFIALQPLSDGLAATWCLAAFYSGLRARRAAPWALACGAAYAIAVLVRPTNIVLGPALLILLGFDWRRLAFAIVGGLPGVAWLASYNHVLYGAALNSGYGPWAEAFAWSWGAPTAWHFLKWLALLLPAPFLLLPFLGLVRGGARTRHLLALGVWFAAITGVYLFYEVSHEAWWCLRFILPALPALILAALLGLEAITPPQDAAREILVRKVAATLLVVWSTTIIGIAAPRFYLLNMKADEGTYEEACLLAREQFPSGTLVVTQDYSGAVYYYTDFPVLRWEMIEPAEFSRLSVLAAHAGRAVISINFKWQDDDRLKHCPGNWISVGAVKNATLWRLVPPTAP